MGMVGKELSITDCLEITSEKKLNDIIINTAQHLLNKQFPMMSSFKSILYQYKRNKVVAKPLMCIQIIHCLGDHWIVASNAYAPIGVVKVYDSSFDEVNEVIIEVISNVFGKNSTIELVQCQKQSGGSDCGVFAISNSTALCLEQNPTILTYDQAKMRGHLIHCLKNGTFAKTA